MEAIAKKEKVEDADIASVQDSSLQVVRPVITHSLFAASCFIAHSLEEQSLGFKRKAEVQASDVTPKSKPPKAKKGKEEDKGRHHEEVLTSISSCRLLYRCDLGMALLRLKQPAVQMVELSAIWGDSTARSSVVAVAAKMLLRLLSEEQPTMFVSDSSARRHIWRC
eukprot:6492436-Amphidinium_carterae.1